MKGLIFTFLIALCLFNFGCGSDNSNTAESSNSNSAQETPVIPPLQIAEITDPNIALAEGNRLLDENQTELAIEALRQAVNLNPDLADAYFKLGIAYSLLDMQMEQAGTLTEPNTNTKAAKSKSKSEIAFENAVTAYKKWISANPKDDVAQFHLGRAYDKLMKDEDAEKAFKQAVKLKPDDTEYQTELGAILVKLAKYGEATSPLKKAIELDPSNARALDLLDDAQAGRQRVDYRSPKKDGNQATGNKASNSNSTTDSDSDSDSDTKSPDVKKKPSSENPKDKKPISPTSKPR